MRLLLFAILFSFPTSGFSVQFLDKTPEQTYNLTLELTKEVKFLWKQKNIKKKWPEVVVQGTRKPHHEYQKAREVLSKLNRYRVIHKLGAISTPAYPSREITPNEVFDFVFRLVSEIRSLNSRKDVGFSVPVRQLKSKLTRTDVYRQLWQVSKAFDPLLGVRGFTPADVYTESENII